jgi:hypothetical protein
VSFVCFVTVWECGCCGCMFKVMYKTDETVTLKCPTEQCTNTHSVYGTISNVWVQNGYEWQPHSDFSSLIVVRPLAA